MYLTLELPKRIINDAIGAGSSPVEVFGYEFGQVQYLAILCIGFLSAVLAHGLLKMRINTIKGVLAERMLRRFRYTLVGRILRFPQPYFRRTSQGELVSMVTSEAEPLGGMMGDAISQPVLQAGQMLTILGFLFLQSFWFGLAAVALIPFQAWLIPKLQRQINLLNKSRIQQVRKLASEIGESAAGASALRINGGWRYRQAQITYRLGRLFEIRFEIYQKKFFMKFLNNFITQLTPFFFFSIGGYLVIQGNVSLGALVAALAAYKDLSSPWKELLAYYNQVQDMSLRWDTIIERFAPAGMIPAELFDGEPDKREHLVEDIALEGVSVRDVDGNYVLEDINTRFPKGSTVGISASNEEDRRAVSELLTREIVPSQGVVRIGERDLNHLHQVVVAARIGLASSRPYTFQGTIGDNVMMPLRTKPQDDADPNGDMSGKFTDLKEAKRAGNSNDSLNADWLDPRLAELETDQDVREWWLKLVDTMGSGISLFRRGLEQKFDIAKHPELAKRLIELRPLVAQKVKEAGLSNAIYPIDWDKYNPALPVAGNLLFASPKINISQEALAAQIGFVRFIQEMKLEEDIVRLSTEVIEMLLQAFGMDGTDHPLFRKLGIDPEIYEKTVEVVQKVKDVGHEELTRDERALLFTVPFRISAEHIGPAFTEDTKQRILALRKTGSEFAQHRFSKLFVPFSKENLAPGFTVLENAIFGKISASAAAQRNELVDLVAETLLEAGLKRLVAELIYDVPTQLGGSNLPSLYLERMAFSRAAIKRPDILILDKALASYDEETRITAATELRDLMPDTTLIFLDEEFEDPDMFDVFVEIEHGRIVSSEGAQPAGGASGSGADLDMKLRALGMAELFQSLTRKQLRLLAFGARWYTAEKDDYVFVSGADANDGAYLLLDGEAGLYYPYEDNEDELITTVEPGRLVGDLALLTDNKRFLHMRAHTDIKALRIGKEEFLAVVQSDPAISFSLLQTVSGYLGIAATRSREQPSEQPEG